MSFTPGMADPDITILPTVEDRSRVRKVFLGSTFNWPFQNTEQEHWGSDGLWVQEEWSLAQFITQLGWEEKKSNQ